VGRVQDDQDELQHLHCGQVLLPPEVWLQAGEGGQGVVGVHHRVDPRVDQGKEGRVAPGEELQTHPDQQRHACIRR